MLHKNIRGKSLHAPSTEVVENNTGSTISKLKVISLDGMGNLFPAIKVANPLLYDNFGIVQDEIKTGRVGHVTCIGFMFDIDTSAWNVDTLLYSDSNGNLSSTENNAPIAIVVKTDAQTGVIYVSGTFNLLKNTVYWQTSGNVNTDESVDFIGTTDYHDLRLRTDNKFRLNITKDGRFGFNIESPDEFIHIKAHSGFERSGRRISTFGVQTSDENWNTAYVWTIPSNSIALLKVSAVGRTDSANNCAFIKTSTFKRGAGSIGILGPVQSDFTEKTHSNYGFRFRRVNSTVYFEVKSASSTSTNWTGTVEIDVTSE